MDNKELDKIAKNNEPMPKCLEFYEQAYYQASRHLYRQHEAGTITVQQAREEKLLIIEKHAEAERMFSFMRSLYGIAEKLEKLKETGFDSVLEWEILDDFEKAIKGR